MRGRSGVESRSFRGGVVEVVAGKAAADADGEVDAADDDGANGELEDRRLGLLSSRVLNSGFGLDVGDA